MRTFTTVKSTYWNGQTGRDIRESGGADAQLLGLYLLTNPHTNMIGLYYLPVVMIEREVALSASQITTALQVLGELGYAHYDAETEMVWVVEMAFHQLGGEIVKPGDKRLPAVHKLYTGAPGTPLIALFTRHYREALHLPDRRSGTRPLEKPTSINKGHSATRMPLDPDPDPVPDPVPDLLKGTENFFSPPKSMARIPPLDLWLRELTDAYPLQARTSGYLTQHAFVEVFRTDGRAADAVWAEIRANLANQLAGHQWRVKRMIPKLQTWLSEGKWRQRHDAAPPTALLGERTVSNEIAGDAFVAGGRRGA